MMLSELIEHLKDMYENTGDINVMSSSNYGDYHNTEQLDEIEEIQFTIPVKSAYSNSGLAFRPAELIEDLEFNDEPIDAEQVLVLRYTTGG